MKILLLVIDNNLQVLYNQNKGVICMRGAGITLMCIGFCVAIICFICLGLGMSTVTSGTEGELRYKFDSDYKKSTDNALTGFATLGVVHLVIGFAGLGLTIGGTARINRRRQMNQPGLPALTINKRYRNNSQQYALTFLPGGQCYWDQDGLRYSGSYLQVAFNEWEIRVQGSDSVLSVAVAGNQILVKGQNFSEYFF